MPGIKIMTDSVACIPASLQEKYGITVIPAANIYINGKAYIEGLDITAEEAYRQIENEPDSFVTSPYNPEMLTEAYGKLARETDDILFITIASALTALNKTAVLAAKNFMDSNPGKNIKVVDSRGCAGIEGLAVLSAAKALRAGKNIDEAAAYIQRIREKSGGLMMLDTLRYVYRTGRMSKVASRIISMFNIRPINCITDEGTLEMVDRCRKKSEGLEKLLKLVEDKVDRKPHHFMVSHAAVPETAQDLSKEIRKRFDCLDIIISDYSPIMGYGTGPGAVFIAFHPEINLE